MMTSYKTNEFEKYVQGCHSVTITIYADFCFSTEYSYLDTIDSLKQAFPLEENDIYFSLAFKKTRRECFKVLSQLCWDEILIDSIIKMPFEMRGIFDELEPTEYSFIERLLMLSGDVELNPGPVHSKSTIPEREFEVNPKFLRKFLKLRKLFLRLQKNNIPSRQIRHNLDKISQIIAQGSTVSQCLSDRIDEVIFENNRVAQIGVPLSHSLSKDTKDYLDDKMQQARSISDKTMETLKDLFTTFKSNLNDQVGSLLESINLTQKILIFLAFSMCIFYLISKFTGLPDITNTTVFGLLIAFVSITVTCPILKETLSKLIEKFKFKRNGNERFAQGDDDSFDFSCLIPPFFLNAIDDGPSATLLNMWNSRHVDLACKRVSYFGDHKLEAGINRIGTWLKEIIEDTINAFKIKVLGRDPAEFVKEKNPLEKWQEECSKYFEADISRLVTYTDSTLSDLQRLYKTGMDYLRHPLYKSDERIIRDAINQIMRFAEKIKSKVGSTSSVRNPPITLYLYGETGVGKSTLTYPLMCLLLKRIFEKEGNKIMLDDLSKTYKEMIYVRASEQEYWDNYKGQLVTVFDDFNQMKDSSSNPSIELFEIIRSSNIFPYPLHMAAIDEKANTNFSSRVILCTSNNKIPKTESLNYPVAMLRRYCKFLEVKRTPTEDGKFSLDSYTFEEYDPLTSPIQGAPVKSLTHSELIDDLVNRYFNDGNFVKSVDDFIQGTIFAQDGEDKNTYISLGDASCGINSAINTVLEQQECEKTFSYRFRQYMDVKRKDLTAKFLKYKEDNDYHVWNSFSKKAAIVLGIVGVISFGVGLYKYFKGNKPSMNRRSFRKSPPPDSDTEVPIVEGYNQKEVKKRVEGYNQKDVKKRVESVKISNEEAAILLKQEGLNIENHGEACLDVNAKEQLNKVVTKNYYLMTVVCGAKEIVIGHCLFIKGTVAIAPFHFARVFDKCYKENNNSTLNFRSAYGSAGFTTFLSDITFYDFTPKNLHPIKSYSRDIMHFSIRKAHVHSDITNFFADRAELRAVGTTQIILPLIKKESSGKVYLSISQTSGSSCIANVQDIDYRVGTDSMETILLRESWEYSLDTVAGDCGAPLFVRNTKVGPGKIIGIHVAGGYSKVGVNANYATPIYKDDVIEIMKHPDYKNTAQCFGQVFREKIIPIGVPECYQDCEFLVHGKASRTVRHATRTQVTPTPLNEKIRECTMKPAWLRPKLLGDEEFDPYMYRTLKFGKKGTPIKQQHVRFARDALVNDLYNKYLQNRNRLEGKFPAKLTFEQAIIGIPGEEFVNAIKRDTSCGYPLTQEKWTRAKIFGNDQEYNLDTPGVEMLRERVSLYEKGASEGVVYDHYFTDCLKDEKKPIEKAHKARMFSNGPVDYLIWSKMYYNPIVAILSELRNDDHISVGTNVYSQDWDHIARLMKAKSNHIIAGDFEGFDSSEQSEILNEVLEVLIELAKKIFKIDLEHEIQMRAIFVSLVNSLHINGDHVIQWLKSLPSGHYLTAIVNSIYVALLMCLVFMDSVNNFSYTIALLFFMLFALVAYGDDHLVAVPERFLEHFNQITLPKIMEQYGMSYTLESKETDVNFKSRTIEQVTYLKRRFLFDEARQIYIAPLDLNVVLEMSMWTKSTKDIALNTRAILDKALLELSLHEEETWNEWKSKLIEAGEEHISYSSPYIHFDDTREEALGCSMQDDFIAQSSQPSDVIFGNTDKLLRSQCNSNCYLMQARSYLGLPAKIERKQPFQYLGKPESVDSFKWTNNSKNSLAETKDIKYQENPQTDDVEEITTFENDLNVIEEGPSREKPLDFMFRSQHTDERSHTVVDFLSRPQVILETTWDASKKRDHTLFELTIPDTIVKNEMFMEKLKGFSSLRATAVIKVQFQTQPFQAGRSLMYSLPLPTLNIDRIGFTTNNTSRAMLLNHVQCDIAKQTEISLRVPFISPYNSYDLISGKFSWSKVGMLVYSPLNTVGDSTVDVVVYAHFENIQLGCPTSGILAQGIFAQAGKEMPSFSDSRQRSQETQNKDHSKTGGAVKSSLRSLGEHIPFLAKGASFVTDKIIQPLDDILGPILSLFGFSKPILSLQNPLSLRPATTFATTDGNDMSQSLALSDSTNVPFIKSLDGTENDEMSFDYLKKIPQFITSFKYSNSTTKGDVLYSTSIRPHYWLQEGSLKIRGTSGTTTTIVTVPQPNNLAYLTGLFKYWTGSLVYTFKFVKTDYHSGRVEFSFHPFSDYVKNKTISDYCYRMIIDLREKSEVSFLVPFVSPVPFKRIGNPDEKDYSKMAHSATGTLVVRALTGLKSSSAVVSGTIEVLVEINAGEDFKVSCPIESMYKPFTMTKSSLSSHSGIDSQTLFYNPKDSKRTPYTLEELSLLDSDTQAEVINRLETPVAQCGEVFSYLKKEDNLLCMCSSTPPSLTRVAQSFSGAQQENPQSKSTTQDPKSITVSGNPYNPDLSLVIHGEMFSNFRNFIKRANFGLYRDTSRSNSVVDTINPEEYIRPPTLYLNTYRDGSTPPKYQFGFYIYRAAPTPLSYVAAQYTLYRGGLRVKVYSDSEHKTVSARYRPAESYGYGKNSNYSTSPLAIEQSPIKGVAEFQVPYYSPCMVSSFKKNEERFYYSTGRNLVDVSMSPKTNERYYAFSAADDMDFSIYIGTPPVIPSFYTTSLETIGGKTYAKLLMDNYDPYIVPVTSDAVPLSSTLVTLERLA